MSRQLLSSGICCTNNSGLVIVVCVFSGERELDNKILRDGESAYSSMADII